MDDNWIYIIIMSIFVYVMYKYMNKNKKISYSLLNVNDNSQDHFEYDNIYHSENIPLKQDSIDDNRSCKTPLRINYFEGGKETITSS